MWEKDEGKPHRANLGKSLFIKGDVSGSEDLVIEGRIEGRIHLKDHDLTIGQESQIKAEVHAKTITISGDVTGDMIADERVRLTDTGRLNGNIKAPRIAVSDGARFKGSVDMFHKAAEETARPQQGQTKILRDITAGAPAASTKPAPPPRTTPKT